MTTVNWEVLSGHDVEHLVAGLIAVTRPTANHMTPSQGDRGMDIRVPSDDRMSVDVYQVKRYTRPLTASQKAKVKRSWDSFLTQTAAVTPVKRWYLAMPLNPTPEALDWFEALTKHPEIASQWLDRTQLDLMASEHPAVVDHFCGNGRQELHDLLNKSLSGGQPPAGSGSDLLASVQDRYVALQGALGELDPFWRYELETRRGSVKALGPFGPLGDDHGAAVVTYEQLPDGWMQVVRIFPKTALSHVLSPIQDCLTITVQNGTPEHEALERFHKFGTPLVDVRADIESLSGPPGSGHTGSGAVTIGAVASAGDEIALDLVVRGGAGEELARMELADVTPSRGPGGGYSIAANDSGGALSILVTVDPDADDSDRAMGLELRLLDITGKPAQGVLPAVRALAVYVPGTTLSIASRGGPDWMGGWVAEPGQVSHRAESLLPYLDALTEIQRHTLARVVVPAFGSVDARQFQSVLNTARLLRGEHVEQEWTGIPLVVTSPEALQGPAADSFMVIHEAPLEVTVGTQQIEIGRTVRTVFGEARVPEELDVASLAPGDKVRLVPEGAGIARSVLLPQAMSTG